MKLNFVYYYSRINIHIFVRESLCNAAAGNSHLPLALAGTRQLILFSTVAHTDNKPDKLTYHSTYNGTPFLENVLF